MDHMIKAIKQGVGLGFVLILAGCSEPAPSLSISEILNRVQEMYAECESYRDQGEVRTVFIQKDESNWTDVKRFSTSFQRPDRFRFEYRESTFGGKPQQYMIHMDGGSVQTWWDINPGVKKPWSLGFAIAGATGVSGGSAVTVPNLLMPDRVDARSVLELSQVKQLEDAKINGRVCYRVEGRGVLGTRTVLWIDRKTFGLRRIEEWKKFPSFEAETTTTYEPEINPRMNEKDFRFEPLNRDRSE
jgi:outer membrane lipoprotein-sorting protein